MRDDTSLCPSCEYFKTCVLTKNKTRIWQCNEYESADSGVMSNGGQLILKSEVRLC
jgi:ribosomal protein L37AE/L43A